MLRLSDGFLQYLVWVWSTVLPRFLLRRFFSSNKVKLLLFIKDNGYCQNDCSSCLYYEENVTIRDKCLLMDLHINRISQVSDPVNSVINEFSVVLEDYPPDVYDSRLVVKGKAKEKIKQLL